MEGQGCVDVPIQAVLVRKHAHGRHSKTLSPKRLGKEAMRIGTLLYPEQVQRPKTRADCAHVPRPCPHVSCRYHLYLDVNFAGSITLNYPDIEPWQLSPHQSCALDLAERGGMTLEEVGAVMGLTRERVRQIVDYYALVHAREHVDERAREYLKEGPNDLD